MRFRESQLFLLTPLFAAGMAAAAVAPGRAPAQPKPVPAAQGLEFFESKIRPVLAEKCYSCHSGKGGKAFGGLRLDTAEALRKGGDSGSPLSASKGMPGLLLRALHYDGLRMPPQGKLPPAVIADFEKWLNMGAPLPADSAVAAKPAGIDMAAGRKHWAFQPVREIAPPRVSNPGWPVRKIDSFILRKLDERHWKPAPAADPRTLIRRVTFDLTGLPPTYEEVEAFAREVATERGTHHGDTETRRREKGKREGNKITAPAAPPLSPNSAAQGAPGLSPAGHAYEKLVDRLLASPRYGERWGRHWLDVARYAEDNPTGEATNPPTSYPWRYRDWVVKALNEDLPYTEFVRRQLAADLMPEIPASEIVATGFIGLAPVYHKELKLAKDVVETIAADEWDERLDTVSRGFLGLTVACARCHDHKFDPITTKDYYALAGVMASTQLTDWPMERMPSDEAERLAAAERRVREIERDLRRKRRERGRNGDAKADKEMAELTAKEEKLKQETPHYGVPIASVVRDAGLWVNGDDPAQTKLDYRAGKPRDLPVFIRGSVNRPGEIVPRRFLEVLSQGAPQPFKNGSGRLELANAMLTDAAPLTARVIVNRVWGWHFGRPLVDTPSNFGRLGSRPSHPELLDDLTARFIANGWSLKWLHREIVLSAAYRQSSHPPAPVATAKAGAPETTDPDNRLLWHGPRRRLELEAWRDAMLAVSGKLDLTMGGPSADLEATFNRRRTLYGTISRRAPSDLLRLFDFPDANRHGEQRLITTTPVQQLYFLNSPFVQDQADSLAAALDTSQSASPEQTVSALYRRIVQRDPRPDELAAALALVTQGAETSAPRRWSLLAHALLCSNAFLFVD